MKNLLPLLILIIAIILAYISGIADFVSLQSIQNNKELLLNITGDHPLISICIFMLFYIIATALSLPFATLLTMLGGFLFGNILGTIYVAIAATTGATVIFIIAKSSIGEKIRLKAGELYKKTASNFKQNAVGYLLFMRLVPLFPFMLVNILPALFKVPLTTYIWTTFIGIIPGTFVYTNIGASLAEINSISGITSPKTIFALTLLGLFSLTPVVIKKLRGK